MPRLITVTLNPAIDQYIEVDTLKAGMVHRTKRSERYAAGKGINVGRTIACLKKQLNAFCFAGKDEAVFFNRLNSDYMTVKVYPVEGITRCNITISDIKRQQVTHFQTQGFKLNKEALKSFESQLLEMVSAGDIIAISGSLPEGLPVTYYKTLIKMCRNKGGKVIFDSGGKAFINGLEGLPFAVKPNIDELRELSSTPLNSLETMAEEARKLNEKGIEYVFVSMGEAGVIMTQRGKQGYLRARLKLPVALKKQSDIGCGDAMVAGIAASFSENAADDALLKLAVACGTANLFNHVPGICDLRLVEMFSKRVDIKKCK